MSREELLDRCRQLEVALFDWRWIPFEWGLTPTEEAVLNCVAAAGARAASKATIHAALYGLDPNGGPSSRVIDVHIHRVRRKLARRGLAIETAAGFGWRLAPASLAIVDQLRSQVLAA